jgi:hypothetical protein
MILFVNKRRVLQIERDAEYPQMWRVRWPDGSLGDMVNLARAKDAAQDIAEGIEARKTPHKFPLKSLKFFWRSRSPVAPNGLGATQRPDLTQNHAVGARHDAA